MQEYKQSTSNRFLTNPSMASDRTLKITEFGVAMEKYNGNKIYSSLELMVSILILCFQAVTAYNLYSTYNGAGALSLIAAFIIAYILTDFVNGLAHMYMDNNTRYTSIAGPFISSFHLHHLKPKYVKQHPIKIYFYGSGTKFWLLGYLLVLAIMQWNFTIGSCFNFCLVSIGILSSVAEVSHYWCHTATRKNNVVQLLQKYHILLSKKHHRNHHLSDNRQYAFLNGMTDPLLDLISRYYYSGYKSHADRHIVEYMRSKLNDSVNQD